MAVSVLTIVPESAGIVIVIVPFASTLARWVIRHDRRHSLHRFQVSLMAQRRTVAAVPDFLAATRAEPGCLAYGFYAAVAEAHMAAPHTRAFLALAGECLAAPAVFTTLPL